MSFLSKHPTASAFATFAVLVLLFYGNTLGNGFIFEDHYAIEDNPYLRSFENFPKTFLSCPWEYVSGCLGSSHPQYRPLNYVFIFLTYQISSQPWFFHLVNLVYFLTGAFLLFVLVKLLTKKFLTALLAGVFFITHPMNSEIANWILALAESQFVIFGALTLIAYINYRRSNSRRQQVLVYVFAFLAMLSKEHAIFLPVLALCIDVFFFRTAAKHLTRFKEYKRYLYFGIPVALYSAMKLLVFGTLFVGEPGSAEWFSFVESLHARVTLFAQYISKLIYPYPLSFFYPFEKSSNFLSFEFLAALLVAAAFGGALFFFIKKKQYFLAFSFLWFAVLLSPVLLMLLGSMPEQMVFGRFLFVPGVGFSFALAALFTYGFSHSRVARWVASGLLAVIILGSWALIFPHNRAWSGDISIWKDALHHYPDARRTRLILGDVYIIENNHEAARAEYEYLIAHASDWYNIPIVYTRIGDLWLAKGDEDKALAYYVQAAKSGFNIRFWELYYNLGVMYTKRSEPLLALTYFCQAETLSSTQQNKESLNAALAEVSKKYGTQDAVRIAVQDQFTNAPEPKIQYVDRRCEGERCQFMLRENPDIPATVIPTLINVRDARGRSVEIRNQAYASEEHMVMLETDAKYQDEELTFVFPTCSRSYYEVKTSNE